MDNTLLKMHMSITIMLLDGKKTMMEGEKKQTYSCRECGSSLWI